MAIHQPLADLMRPKTLDEMVGQRELLAPGKPLRQIIEKQLPISIILWGPPGCGKSTLASVMANTMKWPFEKFNASIENKSSLQKLISKHPDESFVLLLDEIHRLTKPIQDYLLPYLENGNVLLVGATTENPIMSIVPAVRSRCQIFEFSPIKSSDIADVLKKAAELHLGFTLKDDIALAIADAGNGDVRASINILDTLNSMYQGNINMEQVKDFAQKQHLSYDKNATQHYDYVSAFSDSFEGSDTDAALYYLGVLLNAGDLETVARRLTDAAYIDIGLADPDAVTQIVLACQSALKIGLPRAAYALSFATITMCLARKSDSSKKAITKAMEDAKNNNRYPMPTYLRDSHYKGAKELRNAGNMIDMFDEPYQVAQQRYMPYGLLGRHYFIPRDNPREQALYKRYKSLFNYIYKDIPKDI